MAILLKHEELTGKIRQIAFETHRYFRHGFLEKVYANALTNRLRKAGLKVEPQAPVTVRDEDGSVVGDYIADLLVEGFVVVELKAVKALSDEHLAQLINYLKATGHELGLLINFGAKIIQFRRVLYTPDGSADVDDVQNEPLNTPKQPGAG